MAIARSRSEISRTQLATFCPLLDVKVAKASASDRPLVLTIEAELPWLDFLPDDDRALAISEITDALGAATVTGHFDRVVQSIVEWRHTAEVHADPELLERLLGPLPGDGPELSRPRV
jgi:hypothetical protein